MASFNRCTIVGYLGADPETRTTPSNKLMAKFSVGVSATTRGEKHTEWFNCVAWERMAEVVMQYLGKGDMVLVEGSLRTREYKDRETQQRKWFTELNVSDMQMLKTKPKEGQRMHQAPETTEGSPPQAPDIDDEIPF